MGRSIVHRNGDNQLHKKGKDYVSKDYLLSTQ
jgi:hypothetical protein